RRRRGGRGGGAPRAGSRGGRRGRPPRRPPRRGRRGVSSGAISERGSSWPLQHGAPFRPQDLVHRRGVALPSAHLRAKTAAPVRRQPVVFGAPVVLCNPPFGLDPTFGLHAV